MEINHEQSEQPKQPESEQSAEQQPAE